VGREVERITEVIESQLATLAADATLSGLLDGAHIYARHSVERVEQIPGVYWSLPSIDPMEETEERATVQWDCYARTIASVNAIAARVKRLTHHEGPVDFDGIPAWSQFAGSSEFGGSKRVGIMRRIVETEIRVVRVRAT